MIEMVQVGKNFRSPNVEIIKINVRFVQINRFSAARPRRRIET